MTQAEVAHATVRGVQSLTEDDVLCRWQPPPWWKHRDNWCAQFQPRKDGKEVASN